MLLGKRPRPPMKRTTSMKDVALDLGKAPAASPPSDPNIPAAGDGNQRPWNLTAASGLPSMVSPLGLRRSSGDYTAAVQTAPFLRVCDLCKGLLRPGRDIFMYRGEIAFCSLECREQQIKLDERKEKAKCSVASRKDSTQAQAQAQAQANPSASEASDSAETVAAA